MTRYRTIQAYAPAGRLNRDGVRLAVEVLVAQGILVHPTSTVYGLGGPTTPEVDVEIARLKGRPSAPLLRLAASVEVLRESRPAVQWDERAARLATAFWPGRLTLVLEDGSPHGLAVRVDAHPVVRAVLAAWGGLMSSTSLNPTARPPARDPAVAREILQAFPEAYHSVTFLDAGTLPASSASTIVSLRERPARLLRDGAVPAATIGACLDEELVA